MWHLKTNIVVVILDTQGMIKKWTDKYINKIPGNPSRYEILKNWTLRNCSFP